MKLSKDIFGVVSNQRSSCKTMFYLRDAAPNNPTSPCNTMFYDDRFMKLPPNDLCVSNVSIIYYTLSILFSRLFYYHNIVWYSAQQYGAQLLIFTSIIDVMVVTPSFKAPLGSFLRRPVVGWKGISAVVVVSRGVCIDL